jgi:hypothetical protein
VKKLKDYVYISDSKVDALFGQIPERMLKKITASLEFDLPFVKAKIGGELGLDRTKHRVQRLEAVVAYLEESAGFGTADDPDEYLREVNLNMRWSQLDSAVLFTGLTDRTAIGLGGSAKHIIGMSGSATTSASYSHVLLECLRPIVAEEEKQPVPSARHSEDDSLDVIDSVVREMTGPREPMEFVAKRLLYGRPQSPLARGDNHPQQRVLLATPLYVARR